MTATLMVSLAFYAGLVTGVLILFIRAIRTELRTYHDYHWNPAERVTLARFVTPHAPEVRRVVEDAERALGLPLAPLDTLRKARALFDALARQQIAYDLDEYSLGAAQKVRGAHRVLHDQQLRRGTCLDLVLLFAGCAEAVHAEPLIFFFDYRPQPAHAVVGLWLDPPGSPTGRPIEHASEDPFRIRAPRRNCLVIETMRFATGWTVSSGTKTDRFREAMKAAKRCFGHTPPDFAFALDVAAARAHQIHPIRTSGFSRVPNAIAHVIRARPAASAASVALVLAGALMLGLQWLSGHAPDPPPPGAAPAVSRAVLNGTDLSTCTMTAPCPATMLGASPLLNLRLASRGYAVVDVIDPNGQSFPQGEIVDAVENDIRVSFGATGRFTLAIRTSDRPIDRDRAAGEEQIRGYFDVR